MASFSKFNTFAGDLAAGVHDLSSDQVNVGLSDTAPSASADAVWGDITEISSGNGYSSGGSDTQNTGASSSGTYTLTGTNVTWTASGGTIGPFQYVILYNTTPTSPLKPLIGWWDYGSALTLNSGDSFTVKFNGGASSGTILTVA